MFPSNFAPVAFVLISMLRYCAGVAVPAADFVRFKDAKCDGSINKTLKLYSNLASMDMCVQKCARDPECVALTFEATGGKCKLFEQCNHFFTDKAGYESAVLNRVSRESNAKYWTALEFGDVCTGSRNIDCMTEFLGNHIQPTVRQCKSECKKTNGCEAYQFVTGTSLCSLYRQKTTEEKRQNQMENWFAPAGFQPGRKAMIRG